MTDSQLDPESQARLLAALNAAPDFGEHQHCERWRARAEQAEAALAQARELHRENCPFATGEPTRAITCSMCEALGGMVLLRQDETWPLAEAPEEGRCRSNGCRQAWTEATW